MATLLIELLFVFDLVKILLKTLRELIDHFDIVFLSPAVCLLDLFCLLFLDLLQLYLLLFRIEFDRSVDYLRHDRALGRVFVPRRLYRVSPLFLLEH